MSRRQHEGRGSWGRRLFGLALVAGIVWLYQARTHSVRVSGADTAPRATQLDLVDLQGARVSLDDYRGRVVVLNLWAGWCPPCRAEVPRLNRLDSELRERGLVVLGVNVEGLEPHRLVSVRREMGIDYRVLVADDRFEGVFEWQGVLPYTWLIDRRGRVRAGHAGLPTERSLRSACERLLEETG